MSNPLISSVHQEAPKLVDEKEVKRVIDTVRSFFWKSGILTVEVYSSWIGSQRWARNRSFMTSDLRTVIAKISYGEPGGVAIVALNQLDDDSIRAGCKYIGENVRMKLRSAYEPGLDLELKHSEWESKGIPVWSNSSYNRTSNENGRVVINMTERAEAEGMLSAGFLETLGTQISRYHRDHWGRETRKDGLATYAHCSSTVRHPRGVGSGWAGASSFDIDLLDLVKLGDVAFDKCIKSLDPVRIEPGRYQTILEPQVVASFANQFARHWLRGQQEDIKGALYFGWDDAIRRHRSKLGLRIIDSRLDIYHEPQNALSGTHVSEGVERMDIVKQGVLTSLFTNEGYARVEMDRHNFDAARTSFVMKGRETMSEDDMVASVKRGLLLTRVSDMAELHPTSILCTGLTRDGLWLIEDGRITKAVRNFRWTESPLFIFNNVESIGESVPTYSGSIGRFPFDARLLQTVVPSVIMPPLLVNDFSFTSTIDAV